MRKIAEIPTYFVMKNAIVQNIIRNHNGNGVIIYVIDKFVVKPYYLTNMQIENIHNQIRNEAIRRESESRMTIR